MATTTTTMTCFTACDFVLYIYAWLISPLARSTQ